MNWIAPMEPLSSREVKEEKTFIHEIKYDGIRGMIYFQGSDYRLFTKKGNERTDFYPELKILNRLMGSRKVILDGEIYVLDKDKRPAFHNILTRETVKSQRNLQFYINNYPANYVVFDILQMDDRLLTGLPLTERKQLLDTVMRPVIGNCDNIYISSIYDNGAELFEQMKDKNMEGIVSKKADSLYLEGKNHQDWFKTKFIKKMLCIIGGIQWKEQKPNSLILGIKTHENPKLIYLGKASLGLTQADLMLLKQYREQLEQPECPFDGESIKGLNNTGSGITWTMPYITCWISFLELSNDGHFRHPKILGFTNLPVEEAYGKVLTE